MIGRKFFINPNGIPGVSHYWTVLGYDSASGKYLCGNPGYLRPALFLRSEIGIGMRAWLK